MSNPDFSDYSLDELLDAQCHIDAEKFPDRVKQIQTAIAAKMDNPQTLVDVERQLELEKYQTFGPRIGASIIDSIVVYIVSAILIFIGTGAGGVVESTLQFIDLIQFGIYSVALHTLYGQTLGKMALAVKVVNHVTESTITFKQAFIRDCVPIFMIIAATIATIFAPEDGAANPPQWYTFTIIAMGITMLLWHLLEIVTMLFSAKNRAFHDFIAGTVVVRIQH